ncbi:aminopeptidase P N-terminal domain-containing protein, partial [Streptomyces anthocyanicus]
MAKARKNGLYRGISDELSALMRTGWADTERGDLLPGEQAAHAARRRAALSALFPGERLVVPSGGLRNRSNDTHYPFRAYSGYVHMTGDQARDGALVLEPRADGGHDAHCYQLPRDSRDSDEFWTGMTAELWMG